MKSFLCFTCLISVLLGVVQGLIAPSASRGVPTPTTTQTSLRMGLLDSLSGFLENRGGDFVKLENTDDEFGPGPAILLYNIPSGIVDEELTDMLDDGAPKASQKGITLVRITADGADNELLELSLENALEKVVNHQYQSPNNSESSDVLSTDAGVLAGCPVLLFSGFSNPEMMAAYNIIGEEIYQETAGQASAACAKAVPNAMQKSLRQVLEEISGDHLDAIQDAVQR